MSAAEDRAALIDYATERVATEIASPIHDEDHSILVRIIEATVDRALTPRAEYGWVWASTPDLQPCLLDDDSGDREATLKVLRGIAPVTIFERAAGIEPGPWTETTL